MGWRWVTDTPTPQRGVTDTPTPNAYMSQPL
jgi:hypothetical protein